MVGAELFDGETVYDSTLILRRFEQVQPTPPLFSSDPAIAAQQRMLEDWSDESFYWYNQALRWCPANEARTIAQISRFVPSVVRPFAKPLLRRLVGGQPNAADFAIYGIFSTGFKEDVTPDFAELVSQRPALADWYKRVEDARRLNGGSR